MTTVRSKTSSKVDELLQNTTDPAVVSGEVVDNKLILTTQAGAEIVAGEVGGGGGGPGPSLVINFASPSTSWHIEHNLDHRLVSIKTFDHQEREIVGEVTYIDANNARVDWYYPISGFAEIQR